MPRPVHGRPMDVTNAPGLPISANKIPMKNNKLHKAKSAKNDEFYTRLTDIEKEMSNYKTHFKDKVVLCNCDDPTWSNFWLHFSLNFDHLGLKKLISTHYDKTEPTYKMERTGMTDADVVVTGLRQNGDFRSDEAIALLKEADIVVTNPPFSLFREYIAQLMAYEKDFLVIGNVNAVTYKEIFPLIKNNALWLGVSPRSMTFVRADGSEESVNACWFTNLPHSKRNHPIDLFKNYYGHEENYPRYDNYDAIEVSKVSDIPCDYDGVIGVPITFMDKYNPNQFHIVGATESEGVGFSSGLWIKDSGVKQALVDCKRVFKRIFIKIK